MTVEMTTAHFDQTLETVLSAAVCGIVFCALWIVIILIDIEASKVTFFSSMDNDSNSLALDVQDDSNNASNGMEVESAPQKTSNEPEIKVRRAKRVPFQFKMMQLGSVLLLILLTYLLLVQSNAPSWISALGSLAVFGMFLRFQIGDELRQQRWDRVTLLVSLFLFIAGFLNLMTYAGKALAQGEIYMGPARIVSYDMAPFNNTDAQDPMTRTNLVVQWGSDWGCPFSSGKVCESEVQGVMCAARPDGNRNRHRSLNRELQNHQGGNPGNGNGQGNGANKNHHQNATGDPNGMNHHQNATGYGNGAQGNGGNNKNTAEEKKIDEENKDLEDENEELKEEIEELEEKNDEEIDEIVDSAEGVEEEMLGEQLEEDVTIIDINEDKEEALAAEDEYEEEMDKNEIKDELRDATDDAVEEYLEEDVSQLDEEEDETLVELDAALDEDEDLADEYEDFASEEYDAADNQFDAEIDEMFDEEDANTDLDETEAEIDETEEQLDADERESFNGTTGTDDWNWDEVTLEYDDDMFDNEYWNYDWDSAWGEYGCGDLFDTDTEGQTHDPSIPAGKDDSWPYINVYGSCKHCNAYILDHFAEEAFEKLDDFVIKGVAFMVFGFTVILISFVGFIKYKLDPPAENQIELLGNEAGVLA